MSPKKPHRPSSKIGNSVVFGPPVAVGNAPQRKGKIVAEVWTKVCRDPAWGWYVYTSQLIEWADGSRTIRMTYYYRHDSHDHWLFGGQHSIEDSPTVIHGLIRATLARNWK
jgi:hypothetical protein